MELKSNIKTLTMSSLKFPVNEIENDKFQIVVDMSLYAKESLVAACYKFTDRFYVHQLSMDNNVKVIFESKDGNAVTETIVKQLCNELIDQQVRYNTNQQFGHIRDLIVEEAFKPVSV
jgi:His-Xaa-Ser system protein HxsD